ncbi:MAG: 23S rRNA (adenine(2503)-C(2))-methyltransferase RlmN, partial [Treponema sp.]|nr:23S rRNA (adenine(2503)-C(2))-methyltransferase RlmN [Treponema sp.]
SAELEDTDGTVKLGIRLEDGAIIEAVILSDAEGRKTACLSTQAGCPAGCVFCKTGRLGFNRNLTSAEIMEQFLLLREAAGDSHGAVSNIVIMGMGEPLLNLNELRKALEVITDPRGIAMSKRRITISTCGISGGIMDLADNGPHVRLALSLTAADESLRKRLMPISQAHDPDALKKALVYYQKKTGLRITLEAVLLAGINTRPADASGLAAFARGLDAVINLIPWNSFENPAEFTPALREPDLGEIAAFRKSLESLGMNVTCRMRKGRSVSGACGQLGQTSSGQ